MDTKQDLRTCFRETLPETFAAAEDINNAVTAYIDGNTDTAKKLIVQADLPIITDWIESLIGSKSPYLLYREVTSVQVLPPEERVAMRMPTKKERLQLLDRDGYHCRFCHVPVIRPEIRKELNDLFPREAKFGSAKLPMATATISGKASFSK